MPFQKQLDKCFSIIESGLKTIKKPYLSLSWGKDSTLLLWLMLKIKPDILCVGMDSGTSLPDLYDFRDRIIQEWKVEYSEFKKGPEHTLTYEEYLNSSNVRLEKILIKDPFNAWSKKRGFTGNFWGLRADESKGRKKLLLSRGSLFYSKTDELWRCSPIAFISNSDIWNIIDYYKIDYCSLYDKNQFFKREQLRSNGWMSKRQLTEGRMLHLKFYYREYFYKLCQLHPELRSYV